MHRHLLVDQAVVEALVATVNLLGSHYPLELHTRSQLVQVVQV